MQATSTLNKYSGAWSFCGRFPTTIWVQGRGNWCDEPTRNTAAKLEESKLRQCHIWACFFPPCMPCCLTLRVELFRFSDTVQSPLIGKLSAITAGRSIDQHQQQGPLKEWDILIAPWSLSTSQPWFGVLASFYLSALNALSLQSPHGSSTLSFMPLSCHASSCITPSAVLGLAPHSNPEAGLQSG